MFDPVDRAVRAVARRNSHALEVNSGHVIAGDGSKLEERPPVPLKGKREQVQRWAPRTAVLAGGAGCPRRQHMED